MGMWYFFSIKGAVFILFFHLTFPSDFVENAVLAEIDVRIAVGR
jgi:hypothetical protein